VEPPRCNLCGLPLLTVSERTDELYTFDPETGHYSSEDRYVVVSVFCQECGNEVDRDIFPEGVCNY